MHKILIIGTNEDGLLKIKAELEEIEIIKIDGKAIYTKKTARAEE